MPSTPVHDDLLVELEGLLGRPLSASEVALANQLRDEKTAEVIAREIEAATIDDPTKIHPEPNEVGANLKSEGPGSGL